jgi:type II secretory pathway pseudopilin PulG
MKKSFTLLEILVVITLLVILAITLILIFDPLNQINKANDGKRKTELSTMKKVLEDWYNDKNCYPKPAEICFPSSEQDYNPAINDKCYFCGDDPNSPSLSPYLSRMPCDPNYPAKKYLYQVDNIQCPSTYWVYSNLTNKKDSEIANVRCQNGCGPDGNCTFNYGVSSSNTFLQSCIAPTETPGPLPSSTPGPTTYVVNACSTYSPLYFLINGSCNICGSYAQCQTAYPNEIFYADAGGGGVTGCTQVCIKDVVATLTPTPIPTTPVATPTPNYVGGCSSYSSFYILSSNNICNICGNFNYCQSIHPNDVFYIEASCNQACVKN